MIVDNWALGELLYSLLGFKTIVLRGGLNDVTSKSSLGHIEEFLVLYLVNQLALSYTSSIIVDEL